MKRVLAMAIAMLMLFAALAEGGFVFRDSITWGMSLEEVIAAEGVTEYEVQQVSGRTRAVEIDDVVISGVEADLNYNFLDGMLIMAGYQFDPEDVSFQALEETLSEKYGASGPVGVEDLVTMLSALYGDGFEVTPETVTDYYNAGWTTEDGTLIVLIGASDDISLAYIDAVTLMAVAQSLDEPAPALNPEDF